MPTSAPTWEDTQEITPSWDDTQPADAPSLRPMMSGSQFPMSVSAPVAPLFDSSMQQLVSPRVESKLDVGSLFPSSQNPIRPDNTAELARINQWEETTAQMLRESDNPEQRAKIQGVHDAAKQMRAQIGVSTVSEVMPPTVLPEVKASDLETLGLPGFLARPIAGTQQAAVRTLAGMASAEGAAMAVVPPARIAALMAPYIPGMAVGGAEMVGTGAGKIAGGETEQGFADFGLGLAQTVPLAAPVLLPEIARQIQARKASNALNELTAGALPTPLMEPPTQLSEHFRINPEMNPNALRDPKVAALVNEAMNQGFLTRGAGEVTPLNALEEISRPDVLSAERPASTARASQPAIQEAMIDKPGVLRAAEEKLLERDVTGKNPNIEGRTIGSQPVAEQAPATKTAPISSSLVVEPKVEATYPSVVFRIAEISNFTPDEFKSATKTMKGGYTAEAERIGSEISTPEQLQALLDAKAKSKAAMDEHFAKDDIGGALLESNRGQLFSEAYQYATGTGSAGWAHRNNPAYNPRMRQGAESTPSTQAAPSAPAWLRAVEDAASSAAQRLEANRGKQTFGSGPLHELPNIRDYALMLAGKIAREGYTYAQWVKQAVPMMGDVVRPHIESIWRMANDHINELKRPPSVVAADQSKASGAATQTALKVAAPNLDAVYKIFEPEPIKRPTISANVSKVREQIRGGLSSGFRPLDKLVEDVNAAYGAGQKRIAGIFEALKGSSGRSEAQVYRFDRNVSDLVKGNEKDFNPYMFLRRGLDRLRQDQADINTALAGGEVKNLNRRSVAGYTIPQLEADLAALETKLGPETVAKFQKAADNYQASMDQALQWQVESGRMSPEVYQKIKEGNQFYAPFKVLKYFEETNRPQGTGKRIDTPAELTKAMEGIEDPDFKLGDMLAAGRMNIRVSRILSDKHAAMRSLADLAPFDTEGTFIKRLSEGQEAPQGSAAVNVYENGKQVRYSVPKEVAEVIQNMDTKRTGLIDTILRGAAVGFKAGATSWNIPFQVSNLLADIPRSTLVSRTGFRGNPVDILRLPLDFAHSAIVSIMGDVAAPLFGTKVPKLFLDFLDSGVAGTTMQEALTPGALRFHQSTRLAEGSRLGMTVLRTLPQIATAIEQSSKVMGVKRAMRMAGVESGEALYKNAKDLVTEVRRFSGSPDFGRIGKWTDAYRANALMPFLNARIQGTTADLGRLLGRDGAKTAAATWAKLGVAVGVPTAALYALNNSADYKADYDRIPEKEKQNYWHFPKDSFVTLANGDKMRDYWRIPKRESSKWIANLMETTLDFAQKQSPEQAARWMQSLVEDVSPVNIQGRSLTERGESVISGVNPVLKAPFEAFTGRDLYRHRDLIPDVMKKASPEQQYTDQTPEVFKKLANAMPDVSPEVLRSPIMWENLTRNMTAGLFTQFLPKEPVEGRSDFENNPLLRRFQAALYVDERAVRQEIEQLQRESADTYLNRHRVATQMLKENKNGSLKDILLATAKQPGADEKLLAHTVDLYVAEKAGITGSERQILALPVTQRAEFIARRLESATPEMKREIFLNFAKKRILTDAVAEEVAKILTPGQP